MGTRLLAIVITAWAAVTGAGPAIAGAPVLYTGVVAGTTGLFPIPATVHPPITASGVASVSTNPTAASIMFDAGDVVYSNQLLIPTPPTPFGVFYSSQGWFADAAAGAVGPNPANVAMTAMANGFETGPQFPTPGPQPSIAKVGIVPGPQKFGGTWDLGLFIDTNNVFAKVAGGFRAGFSVAPAHVGQPVSNLIGTFGAYHSTSGFTNPMFSDTVCPTTPASCPWSISTYLQAEVTGFRWTTGMVTAVNANPPITFLPPTGTLILTGTDNRSGPLSSMGTLQLVSAYNSYVRGVAPFTGTNAFRATLTFLPEPGSTMLLVAGVIGLLVIRRLHGSGR